MNLRLYKPDNNWLQILAEHFCLGGGLWPKTFASENSARRLLLLPRTLAEDLGRRLFPWPGTLAEDLCLGRVFWRRTFALAKRIPEHRGRPLRTFVSTRDHHGVYSWTQRTTSVYVREPEDHHFVYSWTQKTTTVWIPEQRRPPLCIFVDTADHHGVQFWTQRTAIVSISEHKRQPLRTSVNTEDDHGVYSLHRGRPLCIFVDT